MLGIILTYHSFFEFLNSQIANLYRHVKTPFQIYLVDNSLAFIHSQEEFPGVHRYLYSNIDSSPSNRHQYSVNMGLEAAWSECDCFLIFDNDMIFLEDWTPPQKTQYVPQQRGTLKYGWLNLLFFWKDDRLQKFDYAICRDTNQKTDTGGSFAYYLGTGGEAEEIEHLPTPNLTWFAEYQLAFQDLCKTYKVDPWYDIFRMNGTIIFHFRALSNWCNYPEEFMHAKRRLILESCS